MQNFCTAEPRILLCIQFLDKGKNGGKTILPIGLQLCYEECRVIRKSSTRRLSFAFQVKSGSEKKDKLQVKIKWFKTNAIIFFELYILGHKFFKKYCLLSVYQWLTWNFDQLYVWNCHRAPLRFQTPGPSKVEETLQMGIDALSLNGLTLVMLEEFYNPNSVPFGQISATKHSSSETLSVVTHNLRTCL